MPRTAMISGPLPTTLDALVRLHIPCAVHDDAAYQNMMEIIDALTCIAEPSEDQQRYLDTLTVLAEAYESEREDWDAEDVTPREVIAMLVESHGMSASELGKLLGDRSLGSRILTGKRDLSKAHIRKLAEHFNVSPAVFL